MRLKEKALALEHVKALHAMCLVATTQTTYNSPEGDADARCLMAFVGEAMGLSADTVALLSELILGPMMQIGLVTDYQAISSTEFLDEEDMELLELFEIKGQVLEEAYLGENALLAADAASLRQIRQLMKREYFHHPYEARLRFWQIETLSRRGSLAATRQLGLLFFLGIGCESDPAKAERALLTCVLWGAESAELLLRELYRKEGKPVEESVLSVLYPAEKGKASLPSLFAAFYLLPRRDGLVNHPMASLLLSEDYTYEQKIGLIAQWSEKGWGHTLLSEENAKQKNIGFQVQR